MRAVIVLALLTGCIAPRPMGLTRVQVCLLAERSRSDLLARPMKSRGAELCADFEPAPESDE